MKRFTYAVKKLKLVIIQMKVNLWFVLNKLVIVYSIKLHSKQKGNLKVISHYIVSCARIIFLCQQI